MTPVTAAMLVSQNNETAVMFVHQRQTNPVELLFDPDHLHGY